MISVGKFVPKQWEHFRLILPAVAVGNVGQLAVDLLLSTLEVQHVGYLHHPSVLPMVGPDPFDLNSKRLLTSWEVYECKKEKLVIVQQRSPIAQGSREAYKDFLIDWIAKWKFNLVILLSSSFSQFFTSEELEGVPIHYMCTKKVKPVVEGPFVQMGWKEFNLGNKVDLTDESEGLKIPGAGIAKRLFEECEEKSIPLVVMIMVCSEGNNNPESVLVADALNNWLKICECKSASQVWKIPISWSLPFGNSPPLSIY